MFRRFCKPCAVFASLNQFKSSRCERKFSNALATQITELSNGLKVVTEEVCSPLACVSLFILTGSRFENDCNNGLSYFIEHMAYKGFTSINEKSLELKLNSIGAMMTAYTSREYQCFTGIAPAEYASEIIDILSKVIVDLELSSHEIEKAKVKICSELTDNDNDPKRLIFDYLHQTAFQGTSLAQPVTPSSENLNRFDKKFTSSFMKENYIPTRQVLAVSGGISNCDITGFAESSFTYNTGAECPSHDSFQRYTGSQIIYRDDSMPFLHVAIAVEAPGYNSPDYLALLVASCLTDSWDKSQGGNRRLGSPLARAASTSHLCERFESFYTAYTDVGLWGVYFVGQMQEADDMMHNIQSRWMHLCTTTTKNDLERAVNIAKLKLARNVNGVVNSCYDIGRQVIMTSCRRSLDMLYDELSCISVSDLKDVGYKYIYDKCPVVTAVGPSEVLPDYTRIRAGMYWLRL